MTHPRQPQQHARLVWCASQYDCCNGYDVLRRPGRWCHRSSLLTSGASMKYEFELSNDDRCAVDLIWEPAPPGANGSFTPCFSTQPSQEMLVRLNRVAPLLKTFGMLPVEDPPISL